MRRKTLIFSLTLAVSFIVLLAVIAGQGFIPGRRSGFEVIFFNVGQGDAACIRTPYGQNILIDGGPDRTVLEGLGRELTFFDRTIDLAVLTHPHDDHLLGLDYVLDRYKVLNVAHPEVGLNNGVYGHFLSKIREKGAREILVSRPLDIRFGDGCALKFVYPRSPHEAGSSVDLNRSSLVARLDCGGDSFLFTGDMQAEDEAALAMSGENIDVRVLKAAHHGSDTSNTEEFLRKASPEIAIVSVGKDNDFSHPSPRVITRFGRAGIRTLRTDELGDIRMP